MLFYVNVCFLVQVFELATGDYLFEPHSGTGYSRDEGIESTVCVWAGYAML